MAGPGSPNADGLRWLATEVLPLLRKRVPYAKILVTGGNPPASLLAFASPSLEFVGYVSDLPELYSRARVTLSPLRFGAGVKIKTIESIQYGVPVVSTKVGAEGLDIAWPECMNVADDPESFALHIANLLTKPAVWERAREATRLQTESWIAGQARNWVDICDAITGHVAGLDAEIRPASLR
jgi:glycosyltransferase involved in cell wall biosynthesis